MLEYNVCTNFYMTSFIIIHKQASTSKAQQVYFVSSYFFHHPQILNVWVLNVFTHAHSKKSCFSSLCFYCCFVAVRARKEISWNYHKIQQFHRQSPFLLLLLLFCYFLCMNIQLKHHTQYMHMKRNWNQNTRHCEYNNNNNNSRRCLKFVCFHTTLKERSRKNEE